METNMEQFNADKARGLKESHMQSQIDTILKEVEEYATLGKNSINCAYNNFENHWDLYGKLQILGFQISDIEKGFKVTW